MEEEGPYRQHLVKEVVGSSGLSHTRQHGEDLPIEASSTKQLVCHDAGHVRPPE
jgi:hypothetical protein